MASVAHFRNVVLDCPDPHALLRRVQVRHRQVQVELLAVAPGARPARRAVPLGPLEGQRLPAGHLQVHPAAVLFALDRAAEHGRVETGQGVGIGTVQDHHTQLGESHDDLLLLPVKAVKR